LDMVLNPRVKTYLDAELAKAIKKAKAAKA
jgi:hypothetical protein